MPPAYLVGELAAVVGLIAMFVGGETVQRPEPLRTGLGILHGLAVLAGLEYALGTVRWDPPWLGYVFAGGNVFNFVLVAAMLAIVYPERRDDGSIRPMLETTFGPMVMVAAWAGLGALLAGRDPGRSMVEAPLLLLAVHYYLVSGTIIVMLLIDPPEHAAAAQLPLGERLTSGFGIFWLVLMAAWWGQLYFVLDAHWTTLFGDAWWSALSAGVLSIALVIRTARYGHQRIEAG